MSHEPPVPAAFKRFLAGLEELRFTGPGTRYHECFGCGPAHQIGLRVRCFRKAGGVVSPIVIPFRFEGPPAAAHGGIVAAYMDEVMAGAALSQTGRLHVTGELTVRYLKPAPLGRPLLGRGRAVKDSGRYLDLEATLEDFDTRAVVAKAAGRFFPEAARPASSPSP